MLKSLLIFGTRPELIKIAPIVHEFEKRSLRDQLIVVHTGQHNSLIQQDLVDFSIKSDYQFDLKREGNDLTDLVGNLLLNLNKLVNELRAADTRIACIIAQGDTATTYASSLLAFHSGIPFYHIESGLRSASLEDPFPEEFYRKSISAIARFHFAPTMAAYHNLINEQVDASRILITGNTVIDNLKKYSQKGRFKPQKQALITLHRRDPKQITKPAYIHYFKELARRNTDWQFKWLNHPGSALDMGEIEQIPNITLMEPVSFLLLLELYENTSIIYTDSGGIQEEAAYLGIPCLVARGNTERVESLHNGVSRLLATNVFCIEEQLRHFDPNQLKFENTLYGSGESARLILDQLLALNELEY